MQDEDEHQRKKLKVVAPEDSEIDEPEASVDSPDDSNGQEASSMYLDTINRANLDFDFEKLCSVTLSSINVCACLVCGKYYQGRGKSTQAYFHSIDADHHVFINMESLKVCILPDGYEVKSSSLDDIKRVVKPQYSLDQVQKFDVEEQISYDLDHKPYTVGFIGLNNIKNNDYVNVVLQALVHLSPLRNYLLLETIPNTPRTQLAHLLSVLARKLWNPHAFRSHVSPHEFLQHVSSVSKFSLENQSEPFAFLSWLLVHLHLALGGTKLPGSSIIHRLFQGKIRIQETKVVEKQQSALHFEETEEIETKTSPFLFLTVDLPPAPVFRDSVQSDVISQVSLSSLVKKYDGIQPQIPPGKVVRYQLIDLPRYLILVIKRGTGNDRNPTVVNFDPDRLSLANLMSGDFQKDSTYSLVANIVRDQDGIGQDAKQHWKVQLKSLATGRWNELQDLMVSEVRKELLVLGESVIQIWKRKSK